MASTFKKLNRDILLEWVYDDNNTILENYSILTNQKDSSLSYIGDNPSFNTIDNQLFQVDSLTNKWAKIDTVKYPFLKLNISGTSEVVNDLIKIHLPVNYDFNEYRGFVMRIYTYDYDNKKFCYLSNFYYDKFDSNQDYLRTEVSPPYLYEDRLWSEEISFSIPAVREVAIQRTSGLATIDSLNYNLSNGRGLSLNSAIFVDFYFITGIQQVGTLRNYLTTNPFSVEIPTSEELEELDIYIQESDEGDFFEIYPIWNESLDNYVQFIDQSYKLGKPYFNEWKITVFEQNIKGKSTTFLVDDDFSQKVEFRPIIKYSTSTAVIDVELKLINPADNTVVIRNASYGLTPDQVSKYALGLKRIKIRDTFKPKIYVKNSLVLPELDSINRVNQETVITADSPNLVSLNNIHASSKNALNKSSDNYFTLGSMKILIEPFDNIIKFIFVIKQDNKLQFLDLSNCSNLTLSFKSDFSNLEFANYTANKTNLKDGICSFKIGQSSYQEIKKLYLTGETIFYITTTNNNIKTMIYSGQFVPSDTSEATAIINSNINSESTGGPRTQTVILPDNSLQTAVAIRRQVPIFSTILATASNIIPINAQQPITFNIDPNILGTQSGG